LLNEVNHTRLRTIVRDVRDLQAANIEVLIITSCVASHAKRILADGPSFADGGANGNHLREQQILAAIGQPLAFAPYHEVFREHGMHLAQIVAARHDIADQARYESLRSVTMTLLKTNIVPVFTHNGVFSESCESCEEEQFAAIIATAMQVDKMIIVCENETEAMLQEAEKLVTSFGADLHVVNGNGSGSLRDLLLESKSVGQVFAARGPKLKQRKSWVGLVARSRGTIVVSSFLADTLLARRPASILLIGVESAAGSFRKNDVVTVKDLNGKTLGRGEVRLSSEELADKLAQRHVGKAVHTFGYEVIHCDYFVYEPA
jgi:glutamate 5-kinase